MARARTVRIAYIQASIHHDFFSLLFKSIEYNIEIWFKDFNALVDALDRKLLR